jgi:hypothetical protein
VDCFIHDRGQDVHHYTLFKNALLHDLVYVERDVREGWARARDNPDREKIAAQFFLDQAGGVARSWFSYVKDQQDGLLPREWDPTKRNVVIFNSSEDEYAAVGDEWKNPIYQRQLDGLRRIVASLAGVGSDIHVYLRIHPNLAKVKNKDVADLLDLRADAFTVISPDDPVSTYALIRSADKVITFGSTVGIEAVFWGTPSLLAGQSFYRNLGATYNPRSHEELMELLVARLPPKDKEPALMYGYYMNTYGLPFHYFTARDIFEGEFKGQKVESGKWVRRLIHCCTRSWKVKTLLHRLSFARACWRLTGRSTVS